jgi:hypothetical protein
MLERERFVVEKKNNRSEQSFIKIIYLPTQHGFQFEKQVKAKYSIYLS